MDIERRLAPWVSKMVPGARNVRIDGLDRVEMGHSAETLLLTLSWEDGAGDHREEVALRIRPPAPGLLEPYDLQHQVDILRALESTPVRAPRAYWIEPSGHVLGREFYVMERLPGTVYERGVPEELATDPVRIRRMCESMIEQLAAIHSVDTGATQLEGISDGRRYVHGEIDHWTSEIQRVQRGPLPALERLAAALREQQPQQSPGETLVHGDAKPGNFAFEGSEVSAVFDWEMATIGDPLADVGYAEMLWVMPGYFTSRPAALTVDEFVIHWEKLTRIQTSSRPWYRALAGFKTAAILLVGGFLFDNRHSDDLRFGQMTNAIHPLTRQALHELGIDEELEPGPVLPRPERVREVEMAQSR
jgi:aminoglycoside phosphotransferase (APT) family kinase protein